MDKIFSVRVDEAVINSISLLAQKLKASKKSIVENAINLYVKKVQEDQNIDILDDTFGSWRREQTADKIVTTSRKQFRDSMVRHKK
ncbi:MAG: hypothetical protein P9L92_20540 [Candidatus Electryonea clarkiae]|nr:hypothetical protein [Candidatus Electryonea clarkiae]MDP8285086.1 hypothetical protein [Candidatus Electryonea clarkiae]